MRILLSIFLLLASQAAFAQAARPWPRNSATGKIEFVGHLPWPDTVRTEVQRQLLARRWYRRKLTNDAPAAIRQIMQESGITFGGVPKESCYRINIMNQDKERFSLWFHLNLTPDAAGMTYRIFDFESRYGSIDYGTDNSLEDVLTLENPLVQSFMESFHEHLLAATKGW